MVLRFWSPSLGPGNGASSNLQEEFEHASGVQNTQQPHFVTPMGWKLGDPLMAKHTQIYRASRGMCSSVPKVLTQWRMRTFPLANLNWHILGVKPFFECQEHRISMTWSQGKKASCMTATQYRGYHTSSSLKLTSKSGKHEVGRESWRHQHGLLWALLWASGRVGRGQNAQTLVAMVVNLAQALRLWRTCWRTNSGLSTACASSWLKSIASLNCHALAWQLHNRIQVQKESKKKNGRWKYWDQLCSSFSTRFRVCRILTSCKNWIGSNPRTSG